MVSVTIDFLWNGEVPVAEIFTVLRDHLGLHMGKISSESVTSIEDVIRILAVSTVQWLLVSWNIWKYSCHLLSISILIS